MPYKLRKNTFDGDFFLMNMHIMDSNFTKKGIHHKCFLIDFATFFGIVIQWNFHIYFHIWDRLFSTHTKFSENQTFLSPWYVCISGIRSVSFSESFTYVQNEWSLFGLCNKSNMRFENRRWRKKQKQSVTIKKFEDSTIIVSIFDSFSKVFASPC